MSSQSSSVAAGAATVHVTKHQGRLIERLRALRASLWGVVDPQTASTFSQRSARAWSAPATLAARLHALSEEVHALEVHLEAEVVAPVRRMDPRGLPTLEIESAYQAARTLAFDLAVEAGRVDHHEHAEGRTDAVVIPPPFGPAVGE